MKIVDTTHIKYTVSLFITSGLPRTNIGLHTWSLGFNVTGMYTHVIVLSHPDVADSLAYPKGGMCKVS